MAKKRKSSVSAFSTREWDTTIEVGDLVLLADDPSHPHVYEVEDVERRFLLDHDMFNHPSLASNHKVGDEIPPLVTVKRVRESPNWKLMEDRRTFVRKVDGHNIYKLTVEDVQEVMDNLRDLQTDIDGSMKISFVVGDATEPNADGPMVIVHICNDIGVWGGGFTGALSRKWKEPEETYRLDHYQEVLFPGSVGFVQVEDHLVVANLVGQNGIRGPYNPSPVNYKAVAAGLAEVAAYCKTNSATLHMPRICCGLAGGNWFDVEEILYETLEGVTVTVYDLP